VVAVTVAIRERLLVAMDRPLTVPGSESLAWAALDQFPDDPPVLDHFAGKVRETFADGLRHDTLAVPPGGGVAVWFVTWPGPHEEAVPVRRGEYLEHLVGRSRMVIEGGIPLVGLLEIDVYVFDDADPGAPALEVEYSFLPGGIVGGVSTDDEQWKILIVNRDLCTVDQRQALAKLTD
jgi:hypothetical protein